MKLSKWVLSALLVSNVLSNMAFAQVTGNVSFGGSYWAVNNPHNDPNKPVSSGRSYFTTSTEEVPGGFKLIVEMWHGKMNEPVSLWLKVGINDGKGNVQGIPFMQLNDKVIDNPTNYHSRREFILSYADVNAAIDKVLPPSAKHLNVGPGSPLFAYGLWTDYSHNWGDLDRGGIFTTPEVPGQARNTVVNGKVRTATELDLSYPIENLMGFKYNTVDAAGVQHGIRVGGEIRSRMEAEGKYQIPLQDVEAIKKKLFALANDPAAAAQVLGADWEITAEMKYMKKDPVTQAVIVDKNGLPTPDPMVDTYYDSKNMDGAKHDMAIRYRWTEGNGTGAWNFKPGVTVVSPEGVMKRLEFGIDTTDDKPETVRKFADSKDPMNPLGMIRELVPGATPSDFLIPSLKITDTRYKFKLKQKSTNLVVEVSLDDVHAQGLRGEQNTARYVQFEADVDHLSTASKNKASSVTNAASFQTSISPGMQTFLGALDANAFMDGRPVMHTIEDLKPTSPINIQHNVDFDSAEKMIVALRNHVVGPKWLPAPQKASLAAYLLGQVAPKDSSPSLRLLMSKVKAQGRNIQMFQTFAGGSCKKIQF